MSAIPTLVADAVTAVLTAALGASSFTSLTAPEQAAQTVRRSYPDWDDDFKGLDSLAIDVVFVSSGAGAGDAVELDSETQLTTDTMVDVAVRYRFPQTDRETDGRLKNSAVDKYVHLVQELYDKLAAARDQPLSISGVSANWVDTTVRTYCDYKYLREGKFLGVVRLRYKAVRAG